MKIAQCPMPLHLQVWKQASSPEEMIKIHDLRGSLGHQHRRRGVKAVCGTGLSRQPFAQVESESKRTMCT